MWSISYNGNTSRNPDLKTPRSGEFLTGICYLFVATSGLLMPGFFKGLAITSAYSIP